MKKFLDLVAVFLIISVFASCGQKHPAIAVAEKFMGYVIANDAKGAYNFFSKRIKSTTPFEKYKILLAQIQPPKAQDGTANQPWLVENEKPKPRVEIKSFDDTKGAPYVFGTLEQPSFGKASFRIKMASEDGLWVIDNLMLELENVQMPGFYINEDLTAQATKYFTWMMEGNADKMYENVSKRIRESIPKDVFAVEAIATKSGSTPKKEGFWFDLQVCYANYTGQGYARGSIVYNAESISDFELPFVLEDGVWKADFSKITPK